MKFFLGEKWTNCIPWHLLFPQKRIPLKEKFAWPTPNGDEANDPNICILHLKYTIVAYLEAKKCTELRAAIRLRAGICNM